MSFYIDIDAISNVPDEELSSIDQIDIWVLMRAVSRKPTYKVYKALLDYRCTLQCLKMNMDLRVEVVDEALNKASEHRRKAEQALANACNSTMSPYPTTCPPIAGKALRTIIELQKFYFDEKVPVSMECHFEQGRTQVFLDAVDKRVKEVEQALVKKYGIYTVDDEGNPLNMENVERVIDVMASIPGSKYF